MTYPGRLPGQVRIGMSCPLADYPARLAETGPVMAQRIFCTGLDDDETPAVADAVRSGRLPVVSFKVGDWTQAASGAVDAAVDKALTALAAVGPVAVAFHHEPSGDGTPSAWAAMNARLLPKVQQKGLASAAIVNGFWFGTRGGLTDTQIRDYLPAQVLAAADVVAADCYESDRNQVADLFEGFLAWADRAGVAELGIGEWGTYTAQGLTDAGQVLLEHADRFGFACWFNSVRNSRADWLLTGDRLAAFQALRDASVPKPTDPRDARIADLTAQVDMLRQTLAQETAAAVAAEGRAQTAEADNVTLRAKITTARDALS